MTKAKNDKKPSAIDKAQAAHVDALDAAPVQKSRNVVFVACKMPHGITLRQFRSIEVPRSDRGGVVMEKISQQVGDAFTVKGNAAPFGMDARAPIVAGTGFAITTGCPEELWKSWFRDNENSDMVKNRLVFAHEKRDSLEAMCREHKKVRSGLERIDVSKNSTDPRLLKGIKKFDPDDVGQGAEEAA
jgi:hypothetical protein